MRITKIATRMNQQSELMDNVLLVVNSATHGRMKIGANGILKRIAFLHNDKDLSESARFALQRLTENHIVVIDVPSKDHREHIFERIKNINSRAFNDFNFSCYHKEAEKFKTLVAKLKKYQQQTQGEVNGLIALIIQEQQAALVKGKAVLSFKEFSFQIEAAIVPKDFMEKKKALKEIHSTQEKLLHELNMLIDELELQLEQNYPHTVLSGIVFNTDILEETLKRQEQLAIVNEFFQSMQTISEHLKLEVPANTPIPRPGHVASFASSQQFWSQANSNQVQEHTLNTAGNPKALISFAKNYSY